MVVLERGGRRHAVHRRRVDLGQAALAVVAVGPGVAQAVGDRGVAVEQVVAEVERLRRRAASGGRRGQAVGAEPVLLPSVVGDRAVALPHRGQIAVGVVGVGRAVARRGGRVGVRGQRGGDLHQPALAVVGIAHLLARHRLALTRRHLDQRDAGQEARGCVVAEVQPVAVRRRHRREVAAGVVAQAEAGAGLRVGQPHQAPLRVVDLLPARGAVRPDPLLVGTVPAQRVLRAALPLADVHTLERVVLVTHLRTIVIGTPDGAMGGHAPLPTATARRVATTGNLQRARQTETPVVAPIELALAVIGAQQRQVETVEVQVVVLRLQHQVASRHVDVLAHPPLAQRRGAAKRLAQLGQRRVVQAKTVTRNDCHHPTIPVPTSMPHHSGEVVAHLSGDRGKSLGWLMDEYLRRLPSDLMQQRLAVAS